MPVPYAAVLPLASHDDILRRHTHKVRGLAHLFCQPSTLYCLSSVRTHCSCSRLIILNGRRRGTRQFPHFQNTKLVLARVQPHTLPVVTGFCTSLFFEQTGWFCADYSKTGRRTPLYDMTADQRYGGRISPPVRSRFEHCSVCNRRTLENNHYRKRPVSTAVALYGAWQLPPVPVHNRPDDADRNVDIST